MSKLPIKAISVAEARVRLQYLKPHLANLIDIYGELVLLENELALVNHDEDLTDLIAARNQLTLKEDELIDLQALFHHNDCVIKDITIGMIDFISVRKGKPVWLCFRHKEETLEYYHDWDTGFVGRKPIDF